MRRRRFGAGSVPGYIYSFDLAGWGWIQILLGIAVAAAGFTVGARWAVAQPDTALQLSARA